MLKKRKGLEGLERLENGLEKDRRIGKCGL